jgi:hypothetical protein
MSDWTIEEYKKLLGFSGEVLRPTENEVYLSTEDIPAEKDWVTDGAVTPIKDQG